jgi:hypothetical protein
VSEPTTSAEASPRCFGTGLIHETLSGVAPPQASDERLVGSALTLPNRLPEPVSRLEAGVVANSLFPDSYAYVIDFGAAERSGISGQIIYASQPVCEFVDNPAESILLLDSRTLYVWTEDVPVGVGARGVIENGAGFIDVLLAWPTSTAPSEIERLTVLEEWVRAALP